MGAWRFIAAWVSGRLLGYLSRERQAPVDRVSQLGYASHWVRPRSSGLQAPSTHVFARPSHGCLLSQTAIPWDSLTSVPTPPQQGRLEWRTG